MVFIFLLFKILFNENTIIFKNNIWTQLLLWVIEYLPNWKFKERLPQGWLQIGVHQTNLSFNCHWESGGAIDGPFPVAAENQQPAFLA